MLRIIIPTKDRIEYLKRLLSYFRKVNCKYSITIADSSAPEKAVEINSIVDEFSKNLSLTCIRFQDAIDFKDKIIKVVSQVKEKYTVICADDDFIIPEGIGKCADFLEAHEDYSVAHGKSALIGFNVESIIVKNYVQRNIEFDSPSERLQNHLKNYSTTFYSVHRTKDLADNLEKAKLYTSDLIFGELLPSCLSIVQGKSKSLDLLYMVRQAHNTTTTNISLNSTYADMFSESSKLEKAFSAFEYSLTEEFEKNPRVIHSKIQETIVNAFWGFVSHPDTQDYIVAGLAEKTGLDRGMIKQNIKSSIDNRLKELNSTAAQNTVSNLPENNTSPLDVFKLLSAQDKYHNDFLPVMQAMIEYPGWN